MAGLILLCALVPFLSVFMPVPLVLVYVRYGGRTAIMTAIVSALLTAMFVGPVQAFLLTVPLGILPGLAFGYGFRHKMKPLLIGVLAVVTFVVAWSANYAVTRAMVLGGRDPIADMIETEPTKSLVDQIFGTVEQMVQAQQPRSDAEAQAKDQLLATYQGYRANPVGYVWALLPMSLVVGGVFQSWINYMLCRVTLPRFGHEVPAPAPFSAFTLPIWMTWLFALSSLGTVYLMRSALEAPWWVKVIQNVVPLIQIVFILYGLAVLYGYLRIKQKMAKPSSIIFAFLPLFLLGAMGPQLYALGGMADTIFDFRGLGHGMWKMPPRE